MGIQISLSDVFGFFDQEIAGAGGSVREVYQDESCLFARSVLSPSLDIAPGDRMTGGVALRANQGNIYVHPYLFRVVCTNGAIMAQATQTRHIRWEKSRADFELELEVRSAIQSCCEPAAFITATDQVRGSMERNVDMLLTVSGLLGRGHAGLSSELMTQIMRRFVESDDQSAFSLMNAVTSVARDTRDPGTKWRLEELGGSIPMFRSPQNQPPACREKANRSLARVG